MGADSDAALWATAARSGGTCGVCVTLSQTAARTHCTRVFGIRVRVDYRARVPRRCLDAPDPPGHVHDELQLPPLVVLRQEVSRGDRREAALRADGQVFERDE